MNSVNSVPSVLHISRRAKRISITVKHDGTYVLSVPYRSSKILQKIQIAKAQIFLKSKKDWIDKNILQAKKRLEKQKAKQGELQQTIVGIRNTNEKMSDTIMKEKTLALVTERLRHFNQFYNFSYTNIRVKKMKSRWGSCSRRGNLNFSHKLILLSPQEFDYVVVHELCHLGEFNHSANFWKLVVQTIPNYLNIRKGMRVGLF